MAVLRTLFHGRRSARPIHVLLRAQMRHHKVQLKEMLLAESKIDIKLANSCDNGGQGQDLYVVSSFD